MEDVILSMKHITKTYSNGVLANKNVDFDLRAGEIHALVGENGAGKSTLMKILFGMEQPTDGVITLYGKELDTYTTKEAIDMGIGMVHQHFMLVDQFTVAQNIMLGIEPRKGPLTNVQKCEQTTLEASKKYNLEVDPKAITGTLPVGVKQKIEILKALIRGAKILILDEPTAVLTPQETGQLFEELKHLSSMGYSIIFISHKIKEIKAISDRITVMRAGASVGVFDTNSISETEISSLIMGSSAVMQLSGREQVYDETHICVQDVSYYGGKAQPTLNHVSFSVKGGTILGIAGVQGNGQTELVQLMTKGLPLESGQVVINGSSIAHATVRQMRDGGYAYIPEDRLRQGVALSAPISDNLITNRYAKAFCRKNMLHRKTISSFSKEAIGQYEIKCSDARQMVGMLSGGNMQKVVVARECSGAPQAIIAEQPTRGIDIGAAHMVHQSLLDLRNNGAAILLISADLTEALQVCDALMVMYDGEIVAYFDSVADLTEEELGLYMLGIKRHDAKKIEEALHA